MDFLMAGILAVCFLFVKMLVGWCGRQVEKS
jgi:hypothetical protein